MTITIEGGSTQMISVEAHEAEWILKQNRYCVRVALGPKEEHGWPVFCLTLPGAATYGSSEEEALNQVKEALLGVIAEYRASEQEIPWQAPEEPVPGGEVRWVWVDVE